jgi:signal peptidase I
LDLEANTVSKIQAKRSSSGTLLERSAPNTDRIDSTKIYPELVADLLMNGRRVKFRAPGYSMYPTILNGDEITVEPIRPEAIDVGDIILYRDQENLIAHRVVKIEIKNDTSKDSQSSVLSPQSYFILRGDARPACDDPVAAGQVLGKVVRIETGGRGIDPYSFRAKLTFNVRRLVFRLRRFLN